VRGTCQPTSLITSPCASGPSPWALTRPAQTPSGGALAQRCDFRSCASAFPHSIRRPALRQPHLARSVPPPQAGCRVPEPEQEGHGRAASSRSRLTQQGAAGQQDSHGVWCARSQRRPKTADSPRSARRPAPSTAERLLAQPLARKLPESAPSCLAAQRIHGSVRLALSAGARPRQVEPRAPAEREPRGAHLRECRGGQGLASWQPRPGHRAIATQLESARTGRPGGWPARGAEKRVGAPMPMALGSSCSRLPQTG